MLIISKQSDYGIILLSYLYKKNSLVNLSTLIKETKLPKRFLARIAAELVKNKLLISHEGKNGGYLATKQISKISLYDYLMIFNDQITSCRCGEKSYECRFTKLCRHKNSLKEHLDKIISSELKKIKLFQLID
jgi:Rrf2 family protein